MNIFCGERFYLSVCLVCFLLVEINGIADHAVYCSECVFIEVSEVIQYYACELAYVRKTLVISFV